MPRGRFEMLPCAMPGVVAVAAESSHTFARHTHEQFGIGVIDSGAQKSHSGRGMVEAGQGQSITVNPGEVHDGVPIDRAGRSWRMLYFDPPLIAQAMGEASEGRSGEFEFTQPVIADARVARRVARLFAALTAPGSGRTPLRADEAFSTLFGCLMDDGKRRDAQQAVPRGIAQARALLDDDPTAAVTLSDLARVSGLSRFQVLRGFAKATGLTPHAYLVQRRIDLARRLIADGAPLAEAAMTSGFADQSHMTRVFTGKYGVSPRVYADALA